MTIEERLEQAEKLVAEVKAELAAMRVTKRNWPERIEAGMVFALFDQLFMPFSHANDGVCRWKICLNDGMISELGSIGSSSTAFGYKGRGSDGLRWSDPTEACMNAADAHESTGAELVGRAVEVTNDPSDTTWGRTYNGKPIVVTDYRPDHTCPYKAGEAGNWRFARLAK